MWFFIITIIYLFILICAHFLDRQGLRSCCQPRIVTNEKREKKREREKCQAESGPGLECNALYCAELL
ncbi:hypothetical protein BCV70DRAFT_91816 [Testicularia cyperi]|uniref:Secreted protein n=1 Tax=Testicularia cyperi TaxID=1882483 RepID=A0A317XTQ4_9BASI|nr:hypothetical protein BCV70DRAFT_91816 [Testicularia cyperi]